MTNPAFTPRSGPRAGTGGGAAGGGATSGTYRSTVGPSLPSTVGRREGDHHLIYDEAAPDVTALWELIGTDRVRLFRETFNRADNELVGNGWTQYGADFDIVNNAVETSSANAYLSRDAGNNDDAFVYASCQAASGAPGIFMYSGDGTSLQGYCAQYSPTGDAVNITLRKDNVQVMATYTGAVIGGGAVALSMEVNDGLVTVFLNGEIVLQWTETGTKPVGTHWGLMTGAAALTRFWECELWEAGTLSWVLVGGTAAQLYGAYKEVAVAGATTTIELDHTPHGNTLHLRLNGITEREGVDYTLSGSTLTFAAGYLEAGDLVDIRYLYLGEAPTAPALATTPAADGYRSFASAGNTDQSTTLTVAKPGDTQVGDLLIAHLSIDGRTTQSTPPSGWTLQMSAMRTGQADPSGTGVTGGRVEVWTKVAGASEPASYTWTGATNAIALGQIVAVQGANALDKISFAYTTGGTATSAPSVTPSADGTALVFFTKLNKQASPATTPSSPWEPLEASYLYTYDLDSTTGGDPANYWDVVSAKTYRREATAGAAVPATSLGWNAGHINVYNFAVMVVAAQLATDLYSAYQQKNAYPSSLPPAYTVPGGCAADAMTQAQVDDLLTTDRYYSASWVTEPVMGPMTAAVTCQVSTSGGGSFTPNNLRGVVKDSVTGCLFLTSTGGTSSDTPSLTITPPGPDYSGRYALVWVGLESYRSSNPDGEPYPIVLEKGVIA